jgi:hypothetical protein
MEATVYFYSTAPHESYTAHNQWLDQALTKSRIEVPSTAKTDQPVPVRSFKHNQSKRVDELLVGKSPKNKTAVARKTDSSRPCRHKKCAPLPPTVSQPVCPRQDVRDVFSEENLYDEERGYCAITSSTWRISEDMYALIQYDCGQMSNELTKLQSKAASLRGRQQTACSSDPLGSDCTSATRKLAKMDAKTTQLRERYERCVTSDLRHKAMLSISP